MVFSLSLFQESVTKRTKVNYRLLLRRGGRHSLCSLFAFVSGLICCMSRDDRLSLAHANCCQGFLPPDGRCGLIAQRRRATTGRQELCGRACTLGFGSVRGAVTARQRRSAASSVRKVGVRRRVPQRKVRRVRSDASQAWPVPECPM